MGGFLILGNSMDDNLCGSIINLIVAEEGDPASGYFGGHFSQVPNWYWVKSPCVLKLNTLIYAIRFALDHCKAPHHSHWSLLLHIYLWEKKCYKKTFICIMLCKKQKSKIDTWEEAWGKNWATQRTKECAHFHLTFHFTASSHVTQNILFYSPTATVSCVSKKKNSLPVSVVQFFLNVNIQSSSF